MAISMYSASVPVFTKMLSNLGHFLDKAEANAAARKFETSVLVAGRLAPDMLPFKVQVLIACDAAKLTFARVGGLDAPKFEDNETTFAELKERIAKTIAFIKTVKPEDMNGKEDKVVTFKAGPVERTLSGEDYLKHWATPNVYFHVTTAYNILRHNGVDLGKLDFLLGKV
ncbi:MAG: hypothetical protein RIT15_338 [Pseudomonadota bacterium]|jgi:uncharacterized protein